MGTQPDPERLVVRVAPARLDPVTHDRFGPEDLNAAVAAMRDRTAVGKLLVEP